MTPGARVQAAIEVLDRVLSGAPAERELTAWARGARYAGSKDRAAVRDHVYDALRRLRSSAWRGGLGNVPPEQMTGGAVMAGLLAGQGADLAALFTGQGHAPAPWEGTLQEAEPPEAVTLDVPDWLLPRLRASLGADMAAVLQALQERAPVHLRVNLAKTTRARLMARLAKAYELELRPHPAAETAIEVLNRTTGLTRAYEYVEGLFEMQDAGSQALVARLPEPEGLRVLDLCAGGGGKALALAARGAQVTAHDAEPRRMRDLPARSARAGAEVVMTEAPEATAPYDAVIADVPCSGSGSWRRAPEAKWRLTPERLEALTATQDAILDRAVALTRKGGWIGYMTCSLLDEENSVRADAAAARHGLVPETPWRCTPLEGTDGFFLSVLRKA